MRKIHYGLVGFGGIAESRIAGEGFGLAPGRTAPDQAVLLGAADINPERRSAIEKTGLRWYGSLEEMLDDPRIEAVFVATSNQTHADIALAAMRAGKHCLVEKPMATSLDQARAMVEMARHSGLSLAIDHMMTKNSFNLRAQQIIATGRLGRVNDFCFHMEFLYGATPAEAASWRCANPGELGGPIGDVGSHCLYMAEFMFNCKIIELTACYLPQRLSIKTEDGAWIQTTMENGIQGTIRVSFAEPRGGLTGTISNLGYEVYGENGVLRGYATMFQLSGLPGEPVAIRLELETASGIVRLPVENPKNIYRSVIEEHATSCLTGQPLDGHDGLHNLELIMAAHEAARGRPTDPQ